ncbi:hypothetical protein [Streptomyces sp. NRRL S-378]|uniref:hypothetical protein n=1 Tax=Streptomyces sp. NRRL S-378 TaxID=1463904 RepID=UPI0004CC4278|nr:hypothetical protein [Streptomyces sp. NRRL S-378]
MPRRTLARCNLLTFAAQPWNLFEDDPGAGGGGGGGAPAVNEHGYPDATPIASMSVEHQLAYWKHQSRKHEAAVKASPDAAELERLRAADAELTTRKTAELTETQRLQAEKDAAEAARAAAEATAATATAELLRTKVAASKQLTPAQAAWLQGSTQEELEASADRLLADFGTPQGGNQGGNVRSGGPRGSDAGGGAKTTATGAELYRLRHGKN